MRGLMINNGKVYAYQALPNYNSEPKINDPIKNAVPKFYLGFLYAAFEDLGEEYKREFEESTVNYHLSLEIECHFSNE